MESSHRFQQRRELLTVPLFEQSSELIQRLGGELLESVGVHNVSSL
jgi:hypothetical protein